MRGTSLGLQWRKLFVLTALFIAACGTTGKKRSPAAASVSDREIEDLRRIPQKFAELPAITGERFAIDPACREQLLAEFRMKYFSRWNSSDPLFDHAESREFMKKEAKGGWYGPNKRKVPRSKMKELLENCDVENFPSRNQRAIAVAPGHLRGLPTEMPFYEKSEGAPFDMLSYPQLKLNEPVRVLHKSRDGVWLFVENGFSNGWIEARDVALVDDELVAAWLNAPYLAVTRDYQPVPDGRGVATYPVKLGTILPLAKGMSISRNGALSPLPLLLQGEGRGEDGVEGEGTRSGKSPLTGKEKEEGWEVLVASAGEGGRAVVRTVRIPRDAAAPFPLPFDKAHVTLVGDQLLGEPYGWGELYDMRDCSALLRDFFLPFGIWLPRTSSDQIASNPAGMELQGVSPREKEKVIKEKSLPFLTLIYKRGHIVLYVGEDREGRPLIFQNAWSIRINEGDGAKSRIIGRSGITSMEAGKELGLVPGTSLLEKATDLSTITSRCPVVE